MPKYPMIKYRHTLSAILLTATLYWGGEILSSANAEAGVPFNPPTGGAPSGRSGASRGDTTCSANPAEFTHRFMPLTPANSNYGLTVVPRPTLFAYIPPSSAKNTFFSLKDDTGRVHYQTTLPISKAGILRIEMPASAPPLVVGKRYRWGIAVLCAGKLKPDSPFVSSWIQRVEPSPQLLGKINQSASIEQAALYGTNGIWYDTIATLATLKQQQPGDSKLQSAWSELLSTVGLGAVSSEPIN
jgi:hypothetical protein